jgi:hypothetical protein
MPVTLAPCPWDMGASGPAAQWAPSIIEERGEVDAQTGKMRNPNGVRGRRNISVAEDYHRRGLITARQLAAATALLVAWERKDRRPPAINANRVDSSPKPDDATAIIVDHAMAYVRLARLIPHSHAPWVLHVARDDRPLGSMPGYRRDGRAMERLAAGLEALADALDARGARGRG